MKRLTTLLCVASLWLAAPAVNTITVSSAEGTPGETVEISISMANSDEVSAAEFVIPLGEAMTYVDNSCSLNAERKADHNLSAIPDGTDLKIYIFSLSGANFNGNDGELIKFSLKLGNEPAVYPLNPATILSNAAGIAVENSVTAGSVTLQAPKLEISTPKIDFGRRAIRSSYTGTLTLKNVGTTAMTVSDIVSDKAEIVPAETAFTIEAGASKSITLTFSPVEHGEYSSTLTVVSDAVNGSQKAQVVAQPFSVNELRVISASGIADEIVTITLRMNNMEPIVAAECHFALPTQLEFVEGSAKLTSRTADHTVSASVDDKNQLNIYAFSTSNTPFAENDGDLITIDVRLNGMSGYYYLNPTNVILSNVKEVNMMSAVYGENVIIKSPQISSASSLSFGEVDITTEGRASYSIYNSGQAPLTIERALFLNEGYAVSTALPMVIEAGKSANMEISYAPTVEGSFSTTMQVYTNDPDMRMKSVAVSGNVYEPNSLTMTGRTEASGNYVLTVAMDNYSEIVGLQFDLHGVVGGTISQSTTVLGERLGDHSVTVSQIGESDYRVIIFSLSNTVITGNEGELVKLLIESTTPTTTTLTVDNIIVSNASGINKSSATPLSLNAEYGTETTLMGDANSDGVVNIADAITATNVYLDKNVTYDKVATDTDSNGVIDIIDAMAIINIYLNK